MSGTSKQADPAEVERQRAEERAASEAAAQKANVSTTIEGGKYKRADGTLVNANDEPIDDKGNVKKADQ